MNDAETEKIEALVEAFITEKLDGRYREFVSDRFLKSLMVRSCAPQAKQILAGDLNAAYSSVCYIFESLLEHGCRAGGNGHHVAQSFQMFANNAYVAAA